MTKINRGDGTLGRLIQDATIARNIDQTIGMHSDAVTWFRKSKVYSQIGVGVLIKNENLILNTFQLSLSFYPIIPDRGNNIFKINF